MKRNLLVLFMVISLFCLFVSGVSFAGRNLSEVKEYELSTFSVPELSLVLSYPKGWTLKKNDPKKGKVFLSESPESYLYEIYNTPMKKGETLDQFTDEQGKWLSENYANYEEKALYKNKTLQDKVGNVRIYTYTYKNASYEVSEFYFKGWDNDFYIVLFDVPEGKLKENEKLFEDLVGSIKYTGTTIKLKEFTSPESDFVIKYPSDWKLNQPVKDVVFEAVGDGDVSVRVLVHKLPIDMTVEGYAKASGKWLKENLKDYKENDFNAYTNKDGSLKGFMRDYEYTSQGKTKYVLEYYFTYKLEDMNKGFTLIFAMPEGLDSEYIQKLRKLHEKILDSFGLIYG